MQDDESSTATAPKRLSWNKGKLIGPKPPLRPKHVWSIRTKLQLEGRTRDLAMFNLAIDSKLRGCDVVSLKVEDDRGGRSLHRGHRQKAGSISCSPAVVVATKPSRPGNMLGWSLCGSQASA
jgi:hypothetical protein